MRTGKVGANTIPVVLTVEAALWKCYIDIKLFKINAGGVDFICEKGLSNIYYPLFRVYYFSKSLRFRMPMRIKGNLVLLV